MTNAEILQATMLALSTPHTMIGTKPPDGYLTFSSVSDFTLGTANSAKNWDGSLEYSTDKSTWTTWDGTAAISSANGNLYLRGTGNTTIVGSTNNGFSFTGTDLIDCDGNIETLLNWGAVVSGLHPVMGVRAFTMLFMNCTLLKTAPELPATTLSTSCYTAMFYGCSALTAAPELPATVLSASCYAYMFYSCTSLTTAPMLPATTLAANCYDGMFGWCTALAAAPALPATTLAANCYDGMFKYCDALVTAPLELPATTLTEYCYRDMFNGCESLVLAPRLPSTTLAEYCYAGMFSHCYQLQAAPELPATTLAAYCYQSMFYATDFSTPPQLSATTLAEGCYRAMFMFSRIQTLPRLPATVLPDHCYERMAYNAFNVALSAVYDETNYPYAYRIPTAGTATAGTDSLKDMLSNGFAPQINTTYYLSNPPID